MARTVRVTVQVDFEAAPPKLSARTLSDLVELSLREGMPDGVGSVDWYVLRIEQADPGDTDDPEWEVVA